MTCGNVERRTILKAAGAPAATLGLAATPGCGGHGGTSADGTVTIRYSWWGPEERQKRISQSIRLFEKKFPKIKVKTDFQDCVAFREKFQTQAAGGNPPDVFQSAVGFLRKYDKRGILLHLKSRIDAGNLSTRNFRLGRSVGRSGGRQTARHPRRFQHRGARHRQETLPAGGITRRAGWTRDEYFTALKAIHDRTKVPGDTGYFCIMYLYGLGLRRNGKAFFTEDGLGFDKADLTERWQDGTWTCSPPVRSWTTSRASPTVAPRSPSGRASATP